MWANIVAASASAAASRSAMDSSSIDSHMPVPAPLTRILA
jgi:hypothetical protein